MKAMRYLLLVAAAALVLIVSTCAYYSIPTTIHYRLSLDVEADGMVHHGSGVIETRWFNQTFMSGLAQGKEWTIQTRGEAVAVDLGSHGTLFALLKSVKIKTATKTPGYYYPDDPETVLLRAFPPSPAWHITADYVKALSRRRDVAELGANGLPMLVHFRDINDPATVERVDPEDMAASLGPGVRLVGATLTITDEAVTGGIDQRLVWLKSLNGGYLPGQQTSANKQVYGLLHGGNFQRR